MCAGALRRGGPNFCDAVRKQNLFWLINEGSQCCKWTFKSLGSREKQPNKRFTLMPQWTESIEISRCTCSQNRDLGSRLNSHHAHAHASRPPPSPPAFDAPAVVHAPTTDPCISHTPSQALMGAACGPGYMCMYMLPKSRSRQQAQLAPRECTCIAHTALPTRL